MKPFGQQRHAPENIDAGFMKLVDEVDDYGLWDDEDVVDALWAVSDHPEDLTARRILDDLLAPYRELQEISPNPFLPLPRRGEVDGPFRIGKIAGQEDNYIGLTEAELNLNVGIFGQIGYGKTMTIVNLLVSILEAQ